MQRCTRRLASSCCVLPHALKNSVPPPKVAVPKLNTGTRSPDPPICLYSIYLSFKTITLSTVFKSKGLMGYKKLFLVDGRKALLMAEYLTFHYKLSYYYLTKQVYESHCHHSPRRTGSI